MVPLEILLSRNTGVNITIIDKYKRSEITYKLMNF